ncbi:MAG: hypothetical protein Q4C41_03455 [Eggerthellaceae bacterium]|nr:hypothetical protein [Eggerthellaceae bacterium]
MTWYGGIAGTASARFRVCVDARTIANEEGAGRVQVRNWLEVTSGDFEGATIHTSWADSIAAGGAGVYADTGFVDIGLVPYGTPYTQRAEAQFVNFSGIAHTSSVNVTYSPTVPQWEPNAPTDVMVVRESDTKNMLKWASNITYARPYEAITIDRETDGGGWVQLCELVGSATQHADTTTEPNHYYRYRITAHNSEGAATSAATVNVYNTPVAVTNVSSSRASDTKNTLSWTRNSVSSLLSSILIRRQVDGGEWSDLAECPPNALAYTDATTSPNHSYCYAVIPRNASGSAEASYSGTTYNTPCAPERIGVARKSETGVTGHLSNAANTATGLEVQRSTDGEKWSTVLALSGTVTRFEDTPGAGTFYYRVRNTRGGLASEWTQALAAVVNLAAPNAPTLIAPASSSVVSSALEHVAFTWSHNAVDGSAQTAAQVQFSTDGETWSTIEVEGAEPSLEKENGFALNSLMRWRVRTKGADASYSPWSATGTFSVYQVPIAVITSPADGATITQAPVSVDIDYSDPSGDLDSVILAVSRAGNVVYTATYGAQTHLEIDPNAWLPENDTEYTFAVTCVSTSSLQCQTRRKAFVAFPPPRPVMLAVKPDSETGHVRLSVYEGADASLAQIARVAIFRVVGSQRTLLVEDAMNELTFIDKYAPINRDFEYEAVSFSTAGATNTQTYAGRCESPYAFFYFGDTAARGKFDPTGSETLTRPNAVENHYAGRVLPVSYDGTNLDDERSYSAFLMTDEEARAFKELMRAGGRCVYKSVDGDVFHAKCSVSLKPEYTIPSVYGTVDVTIKHIDGKEL